MPADTAMYKPIRARNNVENVRRRHIQRTTQDAVQNNTIPPACHAIAWQRHEQLPMQTTTVNVHSPNNSGALVRRSRHWLSATSVSTTTAPSGVESRNVGRSQ